MKLDHPANCLTFNLQRAARSLGRGFEQAAKSAGLTAPQFSTLAQLDGHGECSVSDLAEDLGTDRTTLTRNLDLMAAKGWIELAEAGDLRLRVWRLTKAGQCQLKEAMPAWTAWQAGVVGRLGEETAVTLLATVRTL